MRGSRNVRCIIHRKTLDIILYLSLLVCAIIFVLQTVNDYMKGSTSYLVTQEKLTPIDVPTLTFCFLEWNEGDFSAKVSDREGGFTATLELDKHIPIPGHGIDMHLSELRTTQYYTHGTRCYKLTPKVNGEPTSVFDTQFQLVYTIQFNDDDDQNFPEYANVFITSEDNAYGTILLRWFDGILSSVSLRNSSFLYYVQHISIVEINEYINMDAICSEDSYYECLAKRFVSSDLGQVAKQVNGDLGCNFMQFENKCTPVSLQLEDGKIPICDSEEDSQCFINVLQELKRDQQDHCKKSCLVKEFVISHNSENIGQPTLDWQEGRFLKISLDLEHPPGTRDIREDSLFKNVRTEYLILPWPALIANVGGTLGMFIGFSFIGTSEWMIDYLIEIWGWFKVSRRPTIDTSRLEVTTN